MRVLNRLPICLEKRRCAGSEDRTHDLTLMRRTRYRLRHTRVVMYFCTREYMYIDGRQTRDMLHFLLPIVCVTAGALADTLPAAARMRVDAEVLGTDGFTAPSLQFAFESEGAHLPPLWSSTGDALLTSVPIPLHVKSSKVRDCVLVCVLVCVACHVWTRGVSASQDASKHKPVPVVVPMYVGQSTAEAAVSTSSP